MRYYFIIIFSLILFSTSGMAQSFDIEQVFSKANELYKNGDYQSSASEYESLISKGYQGSSLYYNLGNTYYRLGKLGYAILYYEKALSINAGDEDVKHNLALANLGIVDKIDRLPEFFLFEWWETFLSLSSVSGWIVFLLIIYFLLLLAIGFYFFSRNSLQQRTSFYSALTLSIVLFVSISAIVINLNRTYNLKEGIVVEPTVVVKISPDEQGKDGFIIHEGLKLFIEDQIDSWIKIKLADGKVGWMPESGLRII